MKRESDESDERGHWQRKQQQCSYATINKKGGEDVLVVSAGGGGVTAHMAAPAAQ